MRLLSIVAATIAIAPVALPTPSLLVASAALLTMFAMLARLAR